VIQLHVHSNFSKRDGLNSINTLVETAKDLNMGAMALTDHGSLSGLIRCHKACKKYEVKPIYGIEAYHCHEAGDKYRANHLVLLVKNEIGWENLIKLNNEAYLEENFYYTMRVTWEILEKYSEGLICLTGCLKGMLAQEVLNDGNPEQVLLNLYQLFGEDLYLEIMYHGMEEQFTFLKAAKKFTNEYGIKPVWTNDVHYAVQEDKEVHDMLMCCQYNMSWDERDKAGYGYPECYMKIEPLWTGDDVLDDFMNAAVMVQQEVVDKCMFDLVLGEPSLPKLDKEKEVYEVAREGLQRLYGGIGNFDEYEKQFEYEWQVIKDKGFADYLWIVRDYTVEARKTQHVGLARGSVAGSLFCQCMEITGSDLDPIKYKLMFERFISPDRLSFPDVDTDFERKEEVADIISAKFGDVAQVSSHNFYKEYSAFQDAGKVLGYGDKQVKGWTTSRTDENPRGDMDGHPDITKYSDRMKEAMSNTGTHAAGIVLLTKPVPLYRDGHTQWDKDDIEDYGLIKFDVLGLKTLWVIRETLRRAGIEEPKWDYDDPKIFEMIERGFVSGVFQMDSCGYKSARTAWC